LPLIDCLLQFPAGQIIDYCSGLAYHLPGFLLEFLLYSLFLPVYPQIFLIKYQARQLPCLQSLVSSKQIMMTLLLAFQRLWEQ
jgi:hypothetical protein